MLPVGDKTGIEGRYLLIEPLLAHVTPDLTNIDWVICGGEYGHAARPTHPDWVRALRDRCTALGIPFLFKGWGEWIPDEHPGYEHTTVIPGPSPSIDFPRLSTLMWRAGKKAAGRTLDGRTWDEYPGVTA